MSKRINVKSIDYTMFADVVIERESGLSIEPMELEGNTSKSKREAVATIKRIYDGIADVVAIRNIRFERVEHVASFIIEGTNAQIVDACIEYGLVVRDANETVESESESESEQ